MVKLTTFLTLIIQFALLLRMSVALPMAPLPFPKYSYYILVKWLD